MNQQNNNESLIEKDLNSLQEQLKFDPELANTIRSMLVDYVTNNLSYELLAQKYHFSLTFTKEIGKKYQFSRKKEDYEAKLLKYVLTTAQKKQAKLIAKITEVVNEQVNRLYKLQQADPNYIISNNHMKDLLASLTIFAKEYRLDNNQATDNMALQVKVEFTNPVPIITENSHKTVVIDNQEEPIDNPEIENKETIEDYKDAEVVDDAVNNADFFGVL